MITIAKRPGPVAGSNPSRVVIRWRRKRTVEETSTGLRRRVWLGTIEGSFAYYRVELSLDFDYREPILCARYEPGRPPEVLRNPDGSTKRFRKHKPAQRWCERDARGRASKGT